MNAATLLTWAGFSAYAAIPALVLSAVFGALFFARAGEQYGPLNDIFAALMLLFLILPIYGVFLLVRDSVGPWIGIVTALAVAGLLIGAGGHLLLAAWMVSLGQELMRHIWVA